MVEMVKRNIYPAINKYITSLAGTITLKSSIGADASSDIEIAKKLSLLNKNIYEKTEELEDLLLATKNYSCKKDLAFFFKDKVLPCMAEIRNFADEAENLTSEDCWPYPSYGKLLFSVK